jgi:PAS domain S-box-containing protein
MKKSLRYTLIFAALALVVTVFIIYSQQRSVNAYRYHLPYASLADRAKSRVAGAMLAFDEMLNGNKTLEAEKEIFSPLANTQALLQAAYDGKASDLGTFRKPTQEDLKALLKETSIAIGNLNDALKDQLNDQKKPTAAPTDSTGQAPAAPPARMNERASATYREFQAASDRLESFIRKESRADETTITTFSWLTWGVVVCVLALLGTQVYRLQYRQEAQALEQTSKLTEETKRVGTLSQFIESVSAGNYDIDLKENTGEEDALTGTLITMRNKLKENAEEDRRRNWATTGLAQIGEILRSNTKSTTELYDNIIRFVVKYTRSNQGGLFILNEDTENKKFLELVACYAFERKKYLTREIAPGDGLVGQCYLEGERIYLLDVPSEYISITSGLGGATPNALLIVPMKVNDLTYGVIELASFNKYEEYEIGLVEKLAESIASTISNVRVNDTTRLLLERTQQQAEEMKSQEEEIRQNMEELEATQEEMRRKQTILEKELAQSQEQAEALRLQEKKLTESQDTLQAIVDNIPRAIFWKDKDLRFMGCNRIFAAVAGASSPRELIGKSDFDMAWSAQAEAYRADDLEVMRKRQPKLDIEEVNINSEGEESWVLTSKVPILNERNEVVAILGMFEDITARKRNEADVAKKLREREAVLKELQELKQAMQQGKG